MSQTVNAPAADASATAPVADAAPAQASVQADDHQAHDVDSLAALLDSQDEAALEDDTDQQAEEGESLTEDQGEGAGDEPAGEQGKEPDKEPVPFPTSWGAEAKEAFSKLPRDVQEIVSKRESEREKYVSAKAEEAAQERKKVESLSKYAETELTKALQAGAAVIEAEFSGIDWARLQYESPTEFMRLDALRKQRAAALAPVLGQLEQFRKAQEAEGQKQDAERREALKGEFAATLPRVAAVLGEGFDKKKFAGDVADYLKSVNAPDDHAKGITHAYQVELIAKAMKYDAMRKDAAAAEKKVAGAKPVMKPAAAGGKSESGKVDAARKQLRNNPDSTDALAALLDAMDG